MKHHCDREQRLHIENCDSNIVGTKCRLFNVFFHNINQMTMSPTVDLFNDCETTRFSYSSRCNWAIRSN